MGQDPVANGHIAVGRAWGYLQSFVSQWVGAKYNNINGLASYIRRYR